MRNQNNNKKTAGASLFARLKAALYLALRPNNHGACRAGACSNVIKLRKMPTARSFAAHALIVMLERSEASYERILRSRMTSGWLNLMMLGLAPAVLLC